MTAGHAPEWFQTVVRREVQGPVLSAGVTTADLGTRGVDFGAFSEIAGVEDIPKHGTSHCSDDIPLVLT